MQGSFSVKQIIYSGSTVALVWETAWETTKIHTSKSFPREHHCIFNWNKVTPEIGTSQDENFSSVNTC